REKKRSTPLLSMAIKNLTEEFGKLWVARNIDKAVIISDTDGKVHWTNEAFTSITGYTFEEVLGKRAGDILSGADTDGEILNIARQKAKNNEKYSVELLLYSKTGVRFWVSAESTFVTDQDGRNLLIDILTDITFEKKKEEELKMLSLVANQTITGAAINDADGNAFWINQAFADLSGYSQEELKGRHLGDVLAGPDTDMEALERARQLSRAKQPYHLEILNYKKSGEPFWVKVSGNPVLDAQGKVIHQVEIMNDITTQKKAELELIQTREEALHLSKAKEMFFSVMSHEIRTPLNSMLGITELLLDDSPREDQLQALNLLKFAGENLRTLLNDILDLTKMETGNLTLEKTVVNINELANQTISSLQLKAEENNTRIVLETDPRIPGGIKADPVRLYQILTNLVGNSIKFTRNGQVSVRAELKQETNATATVAFTVSDTGIGIESDKLESIFQPYTQASPDTTRKYGGTGLGLTIVKNLLKLHGSEISLISTPGEGSTFMFTIEFDKADRLETPATSDLSSSRILVVDDNAINRVVTGKVLTSLNAEVEFAENGQQALEKIKSNQYDCVLMDVHMPVLDGIAATSAIRALSAAYYQQLPILALSATTDEQDLHSILESGMNGHITKPFTRESLLAKIRENAFKGLQ
ncbi:MAG TPA: PAS domain-containing protein, partial [Sphingobacteriaceae bacterium]